MDKEERDLIESGRPVQIFHIGSVGQMNPNATTVTNNYYGDQFVPKNEDAVMQVAEATDQSQPDYTKCSIFPYLADKSRADVIIMTLRNEIASLTKPKDKLRVIRALHEGGYFTTILPLQAYIDEFGEMSKATYSTWMGSELRFETSELDSILSIFATKLK